MPKIILINSMMVGIGKSSITGIDWVDSWLDALILAKLQKRFRLTEFQFELYDRFESAPELKPNQFYLINANLRSLIKVADAQNLQYATYSTGAIFSKTALDNLSRTVLKWKNFN